MTIRLFSVFLLGILDLGLGSAGSVFSLEEKIFILLRIWGWLVGLDVGQGFSFYLKLYWTRTLAKLLK